MDDENKEEFWRAWKDKVPPDFKEYVIDKEIRNRIERYGGGYDVGLNNSTTYNSGGIHINSDFLEFLIFVFSRLWLVFVETTKCIYFFSKEVFAYLLYRIFKDHRY